MCIGLYFDDGLGVSIGRWSFYVINKLFHVTGFEPFIMEFAAVLISDVCKELSGQQY